jgi:outer membrane lipoprotein-sorting protein
MLLDHHPHDIFARRVAKEEDTRMHVSVSRCALVAFGILSASVAAAQTVDEIVARHVEARGGYERLKTIETMKITRTVATPFSDIQVVVYKKRPHLLRFEQTPPGQPMIPRGVSATEAWDTVQGKVVVRLPQAFAETRDLEADFDGLLINWKEKGHKVELVGKESMPGGDVYKLQVTTKSGASGHLYLDAKTYLDRRHVNLTSNRQAQVVVDFGGWRDVSGVKFPFDIAEERTGKGPVQSLVTYTDRIEVNVPIEDAMFATPKGSGGA